ncbi:hypothetical protein [Rhodanobacter lindaniclasticus]|uniref:Uncharacterized protein n=1 Tax=Rhodanobacter lindaniclasticus TaxID=75310 RepID=A0A4S3KG32_9GAMM|nr:hypothetical protein [Rhodanobacter lindaniclasticus]THD06914.1 hypothetical protein B1991_11325 [Rhodanobacter lindaniclasticus]
MQSAYHLLDRPILAGTGSSPEHSRAAAQSVLVPMLWLIAGGCAAATVDTAVAMAWWGPKGIAPEHILQGFASWFIGPRAFAGGLVTALAGALIYAQMMCALVVVYYVCARRSASLWERPLLCGGVYGALAYFAIFQVMVPALTGAHPKTLDMVWIATCLAVYITVVGSFCALFSRAAGAARR